MQIISRCFLVYAVCGIFCLTAAAQCPNRPNAGTVVQDALSLSSTNGVLNADFAIAHSVDQAGFTHYCYIYKTATGYAEAPTLRLNQGDQLLLGVKNHIELGNTKTKESSFSMKMDMSDPLAVCGDTGTETIASTNVHFHGLNVPPTCHSDNVINTLIQPNTPGFQFNFQIPADEPPGLYWYHPHIHGFTEFQVNGGAAGAIVVEGMEKFRPEVTGLTERVFTIRQQYLVPWIPGPYQLSINFQVADFPNEPNPVIEMKPGEKQFWRIANATIQDFLQLQFLVNGTAQPVELIALDGYPLAKTRNETSILVPPASRAEFIVQAPASGQTGSFMTQTYSTGPTGNPDLEQTLATIKLTGDGNSGQPIKPAAPAAPPISDHLKFANLKDRAPTTSRNLYFSEEFGGTNGPIQFYITVDGQKQRVFEPNEKPVITTKVGAIEDWTIENRALETHAFHIHQIHFMMLEVDGKPVTNDMRDTIEIPYWEGVGHPYHSVKVRMDFSDPTIAGTFLFHCHILLHEDLGMMHKILVEP